MARLVGTGNAPEGAYPEGQIFDSPDGSTEYESLKANNWAEDVAPEDDPARTPRQIAEAIVQGALISNPVDAKLAEQYQGFGDNPDEGVDPWEVVRTQDPDPSAHESDVRSDTAKEATGDKDDDESKPAAHKAGAAATQASVGEAKPKADAPGAPRADASKRR